MRLGTIIVERGQRYRVIGHRPHTTRDGRDIVLMELETQCADCGCRFVTASPDGKTTDLSKRCAAHRKPGIKARRRS